MMNRDTELFVAGKELEQAAREFEQSLVVLKMTIERAIVNSETAAKKLQDAATHVMNILKP